jgi:hypothetical protein
VAAQQRNVQRRAAVAVLLIDQHLGELTVRS